MAKALPTTARPSLASGFARNATESAYPGLWAGLSLACVPALGIQGSVLPDFSGHGRVGTHTGAIWNTVGGPSIEFDGTNDEVNFGSTNALVPASTDVTFVLYYQKTDGTARASAAFGSLVGGVTTAAIGCHLPYSDGTVYWDFGGNGSPNRVTYAGGTFGNDVWVFRGGQLGMQIWQNGIVRANSTTAVSRTAASPDQNFKLGEYASTTASDLARTRIFLVYNRALSQEEVQLLSHDPLAPFRRAARSMVNAVSGSDIEEDTNNALVLVSTASASTADPTSSDLVLADIVEFNLEVGNIQVIEHDLGLIDTADGDNADVQEVEHDLALVQTLTFIGPLYKTVPQTMGLEHQAVGVLGVPWLPIEIEHELGLVSEVRRNIPLSVESELSFIQSTFGRQTVTTTLALTGVALAGRWYGIEHELGLEQTLELQATFLRDGEDDDFLQHSVTFYLDSPCARKEYNVFQGADGDGDGIPTRPLMFRTDFVLETLSGPKTTVRMRSPEMDDRDRTGFNRVNRETRGGELNIFADPIWPKINTLLVTIIALKQSKIIELQSFMLATLGQQIILRDWKGRAWIGVITTPGDIATEDEREAWTVSFEFEGEPVDGQYIAERIEFDEAVVRGGDFRDAGTHGLSLDQTVSFVVE